MFKKESQIVKLLKLFKAIPCVYLPPSSLQRMLSHCGCVCLRTKKKVKVQSRNIDWSSFCHYPKFVVADNCVKMKLHVIQVIETPTNNQ